jgi:cytochrome c oxidase subunit II
MKTQNRLRWIGYLAILMLTTLAGCAGGPQPLTDAERSLQPTGTIDNGVRVIQLQASQYEFTPDPMVVRAGERVRIEAVSMDVEHGLNIPAYDIDRKLPPGKPQTITFTADRQGVFPLHCSVFCGWGHPGMRGRLVVLPAQA